ncbi:MAG: sugar isomerase domain-containing protein [Erysipelotrichia bacterium]|nr:sugar isomerase domain-containing protein [Erysipelotrichia bacterium]
MNSKEYLQIVKKQIDSMIEQQRETILQTAEMMGQCFVENGLAQVCGLDSGSAFAMELYYRAGGLMPFHRFNSKDLALRKVMTEEEISSEQFNGKKENAEKWWGIYRVDSKDMFMICDLNGHTPVLVELAKLAKERGHKVVALVCRKQMDQYISTDPEDTGITEYADIILDTGAEYPEPVGTVNGKYKVGLTNTVLVDVLAQSLNAETYAWLKRNGHDRMVLLSANVTGADVHNRAISDQYADRWNS